MTSRPRVRDKTAGMSSDDLAERLLDVEVKLAYQDRLVAQLDEVVRELGARVVALSAEVERLRTAGDEKAP